MCPSELQSAWHDRRDLNMRYKCITADKRFDRLVGVRHVRYYCRGHSGAGSFRIELVGQRCMHCRSNERAHSFVASQCVLEAAVRSLRGMCGLLQYGHGPNAQNGLVAACRRTTTSCQASSADSLHSDTVNTTCMRVSLHYRLIAVAIICCQHSLHDGMPWQQHA